jgi:2-iminobutanoate/2-iminopropanoate deaminase
LITIYGGNPRISFLVLEGETMSADPQLPLSPARRAGDVLYISGQIGIETDGSVPTDFGRQVELAIGNLERVLAANGGHLADLVKTTVILTDIADFAAMNEIYAGRFAANPPARTTIVCGLALPALRFEIDGVAVVHD